MQRIEQGLYYIWLLYVEMMKRFYEDPELRSSQLLSYNINTILTVYHLHLKVCVFQQLTAKYFKMISAQHSSNNGKN